MTTVELPAQNMFTEADRALADMIGLNQINLEDLTRTQVHNLGDISIMGTNDEVPVMRFHTGPDDATKRGGTKFKYYPMGEDGQISDGVDHARSMFYKIGVVGGANTPPLPAMDGQPAPSLPIGYAGGKTIAGVNHRMYSPEQNADAMRQVARRMYEAGLTDPLVDGTAGDEGTNGLIGHYVDELRQLGHAHPEAAITGKADMHTRPAATGRGAAISHRAHMRHVGEANAAVAVQGAGAAGLHYAAEAHDPINPDDLAQEITVKALGDIKLLADGGVQPITLHSEDAKGLPITREMAHVLMSNPNDPDLQATKGNRLLALARKLEAKGVDVRVSENDVLTYDRADYLAPAATSNVITANNVEALGARRILEIGNHTIRSDAAPLMGPLGFTVVPGELVNAGGVRISIEENRRDLAEIRAQETGGLYLPTSDNEYDQRLHQAMTTATTQVHALAEKVGTDLQTAANALGLASYAVARGIQVDTTVRDILAA